MSESLTDDEWNDLQTLATVDGVIRVGEQVFEKLLGEVRQSRARDAGASPRQVLDDLLERADAKGRMGYDNSTALFSALADMREKHK